MMFPAVSYAGLQFRLLLLQPDFKTPVQINHRYDTAIGEGRTGIEERRPETAGLLLAFKAHLKAYRGTAADWRTGLAALGNLPIALPLWVDALAVADWDQRIYEAEKVINFDPVSGAYAIYARASLPGSPAYPLYAPLLLARWQNRPPADGDTAETADIDLDVAQAAPWEWRIGVHTYGSAWTEEPNWVRPVRDISEYPLELIELNNAIAPALDRVNLMPRWHQEATFTFKTRLAIRTALTHFVAQQGAWGTWACPSWFHPGTTERATVTARYASDSLSLSFKTSDLAEAKIGFIEELSTPGRDQNRPAEIFLFQFSYAHDPTHPELYTNWNAPLTLTEGTYQPTQILQKEIIRDLRPQNEKAEIQLAYVADSLMADWILARIFGVVTVTIWKCDPANPGSTRGEPVFQGLVKSVVPEGNTLAVTATLFGTLLERRVPGYVYGPRCNTYVFSPICGLSEASWRVAGTASAGDLSADGRELTVHSASGAAHWFAGGILRTGTGRATQIATIIDSTAASGGLVTAKLRRPLWADKITAGQAVQLVPGCDGQCSTCKTKFNNYVNFRGMPFIPDYLATHDVSMPKSSK